MLRTAEWTFGINHPWGAEQRTKPRCEGLGIPQYREGSVKEQGKGTGLGLSTVYGIVKLHNGHISVDSTQGMGSTVKIYLPRAEGAVKACAEPLAEVKRTRGMETVLLVEDDDQLRHLTSQILRGQG